MESIWFGRGLLHLVQVSRFGLDPFRIINQISAAERFQGWLLYILPVRFFCFPIWQDVFYK